MSRIVGLDTGGTYTDGVLFDPERGVLATGKALTTQHDLSIGLAAALDRVLPPAVGEIDLVCISTTLATNAVVEGHGSPVGLLLIGFEEQALERGGLGAALGGDPVAFIRGGHSVFGEEQQPLDVEAARKAIEEMAPAVAAFAIAGIFAVRNPAHEQALRDLVREVSGLPATCGHELSSKLDAPRRALTTLLNARLIPQLEHLIEAVEGLLRGKGIHAPLMVVKGDGSLEDAALALHRPVETILSGPAASLVGAHHLSREENGIVVDMGGTTTDIALLHEGLPVIQETGARVGGWKTMVEAVSIHTTGLGGDSEVHVDVDGVVTLGPRRCMPVSLLADQYPAVLRTLEEQAKSPAKTHHGRFVVRLRALEGRAALPRTQRRVWDALESGPAALVDLHRDGLTGRALDALVDRGLAIFCGFTPSDACHVLGKHVHWSTRAASLAAAIWMRKPESGPKFASPEAFSRSVLEAVTQQSGRAILDALLAESSEHSLASGGRLGRALVDWFLSPQRDPHLLFRPIFAIDRPLVAIGAPVATYYPSVAERLNVRLVVPPCAEVANAVGAAAAGVMQLVSILVSQPDERTFRVHLPDGIHDFTRLDDAYELASRSARDLARERAEEAGAVDIRIKEHRRETIVHSDWGENIFVEAIVKARALGRPRLVKSRRGQANEP
ncbi:MAG: hydantoinase/oxoprolinase family protein [Myxococcales bacterium]|nr:hydantoinase/oxoprolinase family protein [Myxococcales bacterium]